MMQDDDKALRSLSEHVPPMPDDLHQRWMKKVEETPMRTEKNSGNRKNWIRNLSIAAALIFLIGGTLATRDTVNRKPSKSSGQLQSNRTAQEAAVYEEAEWETEDYDIPMEAMAVGNSASIPVSAAGMQADAAEAENARKIIREVSLTITAKDCSAAVEALKTACESHGGWVSSVTQRNDASASLTLRVPAGSLDAFLTASESSGRITRREESSRDVTDSYRDTKTRLETRKALRERLLGLMASASDMDDLLALETKLSDVDYEIESLTGSLIRTDRQVDYATVSISVVRETPAITSVDPELTLGERIVGALRSGWESFTEFLADMCVFLFGALPVLAALGAAALILWRIFRKRTRKENHDEA